MRKIILLTLFSFAIYPLKAQNTDPEKLIRETLMNYIEGRNNGIPERLQNAFHPAAELKFVNQDTQELMVWSLDEYVKKITPGRKANCTAEITNVRIFNDAAQATVVLTYPNTTFYDYMSLLKIKGEWLIVDKIFSKEQSGNN